MGGRGSASRIKTSELDRSEWHEAFSPGVDFERTGDVNHDTRRVSWDLQRQWDRFAHDDASSRDRFVLDKEWTEGPDGKMTTYGYIRTFNSFKINDALYNPENAGKTDEEIFTRRDTSGRLRDLETVKALDRMINSHTTSVNGTYSRYTDAEAIKATFGFTDKQINLIAKAGMMTSKDLARLEKHITGRSGYSRAFTSASANRSLNAFKDKKVWERRFYVPEGTKAYIPAHNAQESETIFGRHLNTRIIGISVEDGRIVIHEAFDGYRKK